MPTRAGKVNIGRWEVQMISNQGELNNGPRLNPRDLWACHLTGQRGSEDRIKAPEMGTTLDSPVVPVSSQGPHKREAGGSEAERDGRCVLLPVRMEGGATSHGCGASRSWKRQEPPEGPT